MGRRQILQQIVLLVLRATRVSDRSYPAMRERGARPLQKQWERPNKKTINLCNCLHKKI